MKHTALVALFGAHGMALLVGGVFACSDRTVPDLVPQDIGARYADVICPAAMACGCGEFESVEDCTQQVIAEFDRIHTSLRGFDEECFEAHLNVDVYALCTGFEASLDLVPDCFAFHGNKQEGESCSVSPWFRILNAQGDCGEGLTCHVTWKICTADGPKDPPIKEVGDPCNEDAISPCFEWDLNRELYCHDGECREILDAGETCTHPDACGTWNRCIGWGDDGEGTCSPWIEVGGACDPEDLMTCWPHDEQLAWCNPVTAACEAPVPMVCGLVLPT